MGICPQHFLNHKKIHWQLKLLLCKILPLVLGVLKLFTFYNLAFSSWTLPFSASLFILSHFSLIQAMVAPLYITIFYHAVYITTMSFLQSVSLLILVILFQVFVGQKWIENIEPFSGPIKSASTVFAAVDFYNDVFLALFHYLVTLLMRLDFREDLRWQSDTELRKIMTRIQPTP